MTTNAQQAFMRRAIQLLREFRASFARERAA
jgi:hypothetical protein